MGTGGSHAARTEQQDLVAAGRQASGHHLPQFPEGERALRIDPTFVDGHQAAGAKFPGQVP